ncbi:Phytochrome-like protein cph2 [Curvibacter sp. AEP1-3]|uniref:EAL domain-containing protein n=1 Tax=Curvibacter sp. AEP1-3 TaxID=1844971 RepID=UPI000B54CF49|nr:EAL domain-containing protein [Curvibacter sp. AEP1-3]ARV19168.1 Phytochrome-like protein cph2 [Curvibacter sp. AEP1-3]
MITSVSGLNREAFDAQRTVYRIGDPGESAYLIESGCVEVFVGPQGEQRRVAVLAEGALFGEVALLDRQQRTATVRTLTATSLIRIDREHVEELLVRADPVIQYLLRLLLERFRLTTGYVVNSDANPANTATPARPVKDLHLTAVHTLSLAHDLADSIDNNQLALFYQPIILLQSKALVGFEALVRWQYPKMGPISPDEFIPLAEKTGLIHRVGQWVLKRATSDWAHLRGLCADNAQHHPFISVNLSAPELCGPDIVQSIQACLAEQNMLSHELRIELTETVIVSSLEAVSRTINALRALGIGIALDDFGTGYAGLDYLQTLPFSCIKIDKVFVEQMHTAERSFQIVKSALELSRQLGLGTVAEGIEDPSTSNTLAEMGCTYAQGYYFARPMPVHEVQAWAETFAQRKYPA